MGPNLKWNYGVVQKLWRLSRGQQQSIIQVQSFFMCRALCSCSGCMSRQPALLLRYDKSQPLGQCEGWDTRSWEVSSQKCSIKTNVILCQDVSSLLDPNHTNLSFLSHVCILCILFFHSKGSHLAYSISGDSHPVTICTYFLPLQIHSQSDPE